MQAGFTSSYSINGLFIGILPKYPNTCLAMFLSKFVSLVS